jgi:hypothetical protein
MRQEVGQTGAKRATKKAASQDKTIRGKYDNDPHRHRRRWIHGHEGILISCNLS